MNELSLKDEAIRIDNEIQLWASQLNTAVFQIGKNLSIMKEKKLFEQLGYETFDDYCWEKYQLKHSQSSKYIAVYNKLGEQYLQDHSSAGIQNLYMISQLSDEDRENLEVNPEDATVNELKAEIERIKQEREGIQMQLFELQEKEKTAEEKLQEEIEKKASELAEERAAEETALAKKRIEELSEKIKEIETNYEKEKKTYDEQARKSSILTTDNEALREQAEQLRKTIKELESKAQDVTVAEPTEEELNARADAIANQKIEEIKKQSEAERQIADDQIKALEEKLKEKEAETENIRAGFEKKLENIMNASQNAESTRVENTVEEPDEKARFKALLTNVVNDSNKVIEFAQLSGDSETYIEKLKGVFENIIKKLNSGAF